MANALSFLVDPTYWQNVSERGANILSKLGETSQGVAAGALGAPVDVANIALTPLGLGTANPVGGSNYFARMMLANPETTAYQIGTMLPVSPEGMIAGAGKLGSLGAAKISALPMLAASVTSNNKKLADILTQSGVQYTVSKSAKSPSTYYSITKPDGDMFTVRVSDHHDYHAGGDISIDPQTGMSFKDAIDAMKGLGLQINDKVKRPRKIIDDETLLKIFYGDDKTKTISDVPAQWVESQRKRLKWMPVNNHPKGGYWTEKD